ncbi:MAG: hypothetical protein ACHQT5_00615 [Candidatus Saccharimonadales bacterium]|jgi:hypothetical protein
MIIFGITGAIGHGKSTLAEAFGRVEVNARHLEAFTVVAQVVEQWHSLTSHVPNPHDLTEVNNWLALLPSTLKETLDVGVDPNRLMITMNDIMAQPELYEKLFTHLQNLEKNPGLLNSRITEANKDNYRPILQWLGGFLVAKVDPGIWFNEVMKRVMQAQDEGVQLCTVGGVRFPTDAAIVRQYGGKIILINRPLVGDRDFADPTERERIHIQPDITILNDAGLKELVLVAQRLYADIKLGRLKARYDATAL